MIACIARTVSPTRIDVRRDNLESALSKKLTKLSNHEYLSQKSLDKLAKIVQRDPQAQKTYAGFTWPRTVASNEVRDYLRTKCLVKSADFKPPSSNESKKPSNQVCLSPASMKRLATIVQSADTETRTNVLLSAKDCPGSQATGSAMASKIDVHQHNLMAALSNEPADPSHQVCLTPRSLKKLSTIVQCYNKDTQISVLLSAKDYRGDHATRSAKASKIDVHRDNLESALSKKLAGLRSNELLDARSFKKLSAIVRGDRQAEQTYVAFKWPDTAASHEVRDFLLAECLINNSGILASQYLDADGEVTPASGARQAADMAIGLYINGEYVPLNSALRNGEALTPSSALIDKGLGLAFANAPAREGVLKTHRGTEGEDAFRNVREGRIGHDRGYLSTYRDPAIAKNFGTRIFCSESTVSTIFGRSGLDVSHVSLEAEEKEVLYNKETRMNVLLSGKDRRGTNRVVLEEIGVGRNAGRQARLINALGLEGKRRFRAGTAGA